MPVSPGWARIFPATRRPPTDPSPRLGVWYPIVSRDASRVVLEVQGTPVALPDDMVETRSKRPDRFTVVYRTPTDHNPASGTKADLGRVYAVCPSSGTRIRLFGQPQELECPACGHAGEVAWWETG